LNPDHIVTNDNDLTKKKDNKQLKKFNIYKDSSGAFVVTCDSLAYEYSEKSLAKLADSVSEKLLKLKLSNKFEITFCQEFRIVCTFGLECLHRHLEQPLTKKELDEFWKHFSSSIVTKWSESERSC